MLDHWWQTELGWPAIANCAGIALQPVKPGSPTSAVPGYDIHVLGDDGQEVGPDEIGNIVIRLPLPPGTLPTLWHNDAGYEKSYLARFPGYYLTGDAGYRDRDGYFYVMSRVDDIINVAGHRLSTGGIEEVLAGHPDVAECAVIGAADELKGEVPLGFVVLKSGVSRAEADIASELVDRVRTTIGAFACFRTALVVKGLPKTRSGKILRGTMKKIADGQDYTTPATIEDAGVLGGDPHPTQGKPKPSCKQVVQTVSRCRRTNRSFPSRDIRPTFVSPSSTVRQVGSARPVRRDASRGTSSSPARIANSSRCKRSNASFNGALLSFILPVSGCREFSNGRTEL